MDPNAALTEIRALAARIADRPAAQPLDVAALTDVYRLTVLIDGLDGWISGGGFLPGDWQRPEDRRGDEFAHPPTWPGYVDRPTV